MTTAPIDNPRGQRAGGAADRSAAGTAEGVNAAAAELLEAQSRLRGLLAVNQSLVAVRSGYDIAQQLVETACATAGAGYARLELDQGNGSRARILEHAAEPQRLAYYQLYLEQTPSRTDPTGRGVDRGLSAFSVALTNGQQSLGTLQVLDRTRGGPFTPLTMELLTTLAAIATVLLDRAHQSEQVERRALWLESMRRVEMLVLSSEDDELKVWNEIAACLQNLTSSGTVVLQVPGDHDDMHVLTAVGSSAEWMVGRSYPKEESLGWQAMQEGRGQMLQAGTDLPMRRHTLVDPQAVGPVMAVPLPGDSGPRGAVTLVREPGQPPFSDGDLELVEDFARQATVALEMAETRSARDRLQHTEAREAIARKLHDDVIQRLFAVGLSLQGVEQAEPAVVQQLLQRTVADLNATIVQIRETIFTLRS